MEPAINLYSPNEKSELIRENYQEILSVLAAHQIALWEYDIITGKCSFSDDYFSTLGLKDTGIIFEDIDDFYRFIHPEDAESYKQAFAEMLSSESKTSQIRVRCMGEQGEVIWLEDHFLSYKESCKSHPGKLLAYTVNVTSQCEKEQHIKYLEEYNRKIIEALPEFIFIFDDNFFITDVLMAPGTILLHPVEVLRGADGRSIYSPEVSDLFICNIRECLRDGKLKEIEYPLEVDGSLHYFQARIAPFEGNRVLALIHDIGDRIQRSQELIEAKRRAEDADKMKSVFLANMSHEIRTPLNAIVGFSDLLMVTEDQEEKEEFIQIINANNELLLKLINDILDLSKIEAGSVELKYEDFDLAVYFNELAASMHRRVVNPQVRLVPVNPYETCTVRLDKNRLAQILTNFVTNAIKYTSKGTIEMGYEKIDENIRLYVRDTGIGIPEDKKDKVFHRFEKLDEFAQGTGLGLSICKAIVEACRGEIGFESEFDKGSLFWAVLPCQFKSVGSESTSSRRNNEKDADKENVLDSEETKKVPKRVLVVEDIQSNFFLVSSILKNKCQLLHAPNGLEAVEIVRTQPVDLVLMDMKMPVMDGRTATSEIRKFNAEIPIIALTAHAFDADRVAALKAGCDDYLVKPINGAKLMQTLKEYGC